MPSIRCGLSARRSSIASGVPAALATARSSLFASSTLEAWRSTLSAAACKAEFLAAVLNVANSRAATLARRAASCTCWRKPGVDGACKVIAPAYRSAVLRSPRRWINLATMAARVCVVGSVNMDHVFTVASLPRPGETVMASSVHLIPGGKGGNQAIAAARAGAGVHLVAALGDDPTGDQLRAHLQANGVDLDGITEITGPSGSAVIAVDSSGEN